MPLWFIRYIQVSDPNRKFLILYPHPNGCLVCVTLANLLDQYFPPDACSSPLSSLSCLHDPVLLRPGVRTPVSPSHLALPSC